MLFRLLSKIKLKSKFTEQREREKVVPNIPGKWSYHGGGCGDRVAVDAGLHQRAAPGLGLAPPDSGPLPPHEQHPHQPVREKGHNTKKLLFQVINKAY